jgi:predicted transcriptional regulator
MVDLKLQVPVTGEVAVDAEARAAIELGNEDAAAGRTVSLEEARQMIPEWISKFESQEPR